MQEVNKAAHVVELISKLMTKIKQREQGYFKEINLTRTQVILLTMVAHYGEMKVSEISKKLGVANSTVSDTIDRLEVQGLVERNRSKEDRRVVYIKVTNQCEKRSPNYTEEIKNSIWKLADVATVEELDAILYGMKALENVLNRSK